MDQIVNQITLCGTPVSLPAYSHENHGKRFYTFPLEVERLSGATDTLPILASEQVLEQCALTEGDRLLISGQIRSFNRRSGQGRKLVISVFAESIAVTTLPPDNEVELQGVLCREPVFRRTPLGREICDLMLAVNRPYNRADYLPCIAWGRTAAELSALPVGSVIHLTGRLQSREYIKQLETGREQRTAYEISALTACAVDL